MAMPLQFIILNCMWKMVFVGLSITDVQANGVIPWLLMLTVTLYC